MTKQHDDIDQDTTDAEAADSLKAWLSTPTQGDVQGEAAEVADGPESASQKDVRPADTPNGGEPQDDAQEPQDGPESSREQDDTANASEATDGPENTSHEDATDRDALERAYADLQAKVAELEAREAARIEAQEKTNALTAAGIKGAFGRLLTGSKETWGEQIDLLKQFAAQNAPAISVPRDPALDADLNTEDEEITAEDFLKGTHNTL
mgnify:FL=1